MFARLLAATLVTRPDHHLFVVILNISGPHLDPRTSASHPTDAGVLFFWLKLQRAFPSCVSLTPHHTPPQCTRRTSFTSRSTVAPPSLCRSTAAPPSLCRTIFIPPILWRHFKNVFQRWNSNSVVRKVELAASASRLRLASSVL